MVLRNGKFRHLVTRWVAKHLLWSISLLAEQLFEWVCLVKVVNLLWTGQASLSLLVTLKQCRLTLLSSLLYDMRHPMRVPIKQSRLAIPALFPKW